MSTNPYAELLSFLKRLDEQKVYYTLCHHRDEAIMVKVDVPGERWEVEFMSDGTIEVERFRSSGDIADAGALSVLFDEFIR